jgi:Zn-dependent protease with chaperone function
MRRIPYTYFFEFVGALIKDHNIPMAIYFLLNTAIGVMIITGFATFFVASPEVAFIIGCTVYFLILLVMFSPVGEAILRRQVGATCIEPSQKNRLESLFAEVINRAKIVNPNLDDNICLFMAKDESMNACAVGRRTVVLNSGTLNLPSRQIAGILTHEVGHISNKDTDLRVAIMAGNGVISLWFSFMRIMTVLFSLLVLFFTRGGRGMTVFRILFVLAGIVFSFILYISQRLWFAIGNLAINASGRKQEFLADEFSVNCGAGSGLSQFLSTILEQEGSGKSTSIFAQFTSTHPEMRARLAALADLGVEIDKPELLVKP